MDVAEEGRAPEVEGQGRLPTLGLPSNASRGREAVSTGEHRGAGVVVVVVAAALAVASGVWADLLIPRSREEVAGGRLK